MRTLGDFRKLTADLPDDTPLLTDVADHRYREIGCIVTTVIADITRSRPSFEPDYGNDPELYSLPSREAVKKRRRKVVVVG
jgi:hypothetical protein